MRCKRKWVVPVVAGIAVLAVVCGYFIYDVNTRFPDVTVIEQYTKDNPAVENGLQITPVDYGVYTYDEYFEAFSESTKSWSNSVADDKKERCRIVVLHLRYENLSEQTLVYDAMMYQLVGEKSGLANGVTCDNRPARNTIEPGEVQEVQLSVTALEGSQIRKEWLNKLDTDRFALVYWRYPVTKELVFE